VSLEGGVCFEGHSGIVFGVSDMVIDTVETVERRLAIGASVCHLDVNWRCC
jgi:hypothetical protein